MIENENLKAEYFTNVFPSVKIKRGDAAKGFWSLDGSEEKNYLASSPGGTATGIGANFVIVDDIIKSAEEAYNERVLDSHWEWYNNTLAQRMERPRKQILIMTRWATGDLAGRMLERRKEDVHLLLYKAVQDNGSMLCDEIMTHNEYADIIKEMGSDIASANYQQEPIDIKGRLYTSLKTYFEYPKMFEKIIAYVDTADTGNDFLCAIVAGVLDCEGYILDVYYSDKGMEITEPATAKLMFENGVNVVHIESNNGGRGFARNVEKILREQYNSRKTIIKWFHQTNNKIARILSNSTFVMEHIYFPSNWKTRFPDFYKAVTGYQSKGKNKYDDAPDTLTGIAEIISDKGKKLGTFSRESLGGI